MAEALGWRWEFGVQIPPMVICLCISAVAIPDDLGIQGERKSVVQAIREFDAKGSVLLTLSVSFLILGLVRMMFCLLPPLHPLSLYRTYIITPFRIHVDSGTYDTNLGIRTWAETSFHVSTLSTTARNTNASCPNAYQKDN